MNILMSGGIGLFLYATISFLGGALTASAEDYVGVMTLYNGEDKFTCSLPFINTTLDFTSPSSNCENDTVYSFKLERVPSATVFSFYDAPDCSESGNFAFRFKTVKHPTTMLKAEKLDDLGKKEVGTVVTPGVLLISSTYREQVEGKLSCVKIERSAVPTP